MGKEDPHGELVEGDSILVPSNPLLTPFPSFLALHREKWAEV
jgi:hypothetical protein